MIYSAVKYYLSSIPTLLSGLSFYKTPLLLFGKPQLISLTNGFKLYVGDLMDVWAIKEVVLDDCYRFGDSKKDVVVDVGAGVGDFSIFASRRTTKVYAFEADKTIFKLLKKNIKLNNARNIILEREQLH